MERFKVQCIFLNTYKNGSRSEPGNELRVFSYVLENTLRVKPMFSDICMTVNIDPAVFCIQESLQFDLG